MKISEMVKRLNEISNDYGDLELFDTNYYFIEAVQVASKKDENPPKRYNMPKYWVSFVIFD